MAYSDPAGLIAMAVILQILSGLCVTLRFVSRRHVGSGLWVDDWLALVAFVFATGLFVLETYGAAIKALGVPLNGTIEDPRAVTGRLNQTKHLELSFLLIGIVALMFIKLSVVFLYRRIFTKRGVFGPISLAYIILIVIWGTAFTMAALLECGSHLKALFSTPQAYLDHCGSAIPSGWIMVLSDTITDLIALLMPVPMVIKLHTSWRRKVAIISVFAIGLLSVIASATKAGIYIKASLGLYTEDAITILTSVSVWNYIEIQIAICAACAITFRPLFVDSKTGRSNFGLTTLFRHLRSLTVASRPTSTSTRSSETVRRISEFDGDGEVMGKLESGRMKTRITALGAPEGVHLKDNPSHIAVERTYAVYMQDEDDTSEVIRH